jgi:hypothetical protein
MGKIAKIIEDGLAHMMQEEMIEVGRDVTGLDDNDKIFVAYYNTCLLFPMPQTYHVHIHRDFVCPPECKEGYELLLHKIQSGEKFGAHLSKTTKATENHDLMLYDWGIYHFHLGVEVEDDGYIQRTSKLLYAYIAKQDIYFLGIFDHGKWNAQELIEIIHKYFPESIKGCLINGTPEKVFSEEERKMLRNAHINTFVTVSDGTSYMGPGWGITAAGTSAQVRMQANEKHHEAMRIEKSILQELPNAEDYTWCIERVCNEIYIVNSEGARGLLYRRTPLKCRL